MRSVERDWFIRVFYERSYVDAVCLLPPTKEEVNAIAGICLSVCLLARLLKNACMDLDEILRVDRCRDMDKLINFWAQSG